ncbi:uncharacterized protein LOC125935217 [Panthera uncia]|uniref:uncharacterized protein LOC125935217 n=1 Tax=Panthera uncia TaxID=29064 RepID=UPI0020FF9FCD|nr:uncharacterized protein LOC125935217 [Panthera uncia]
MQSGGRSVIPHLRGTGGPQEILGGLLPSTTPPASHWLITERHEAEFSRLKNRFGASGWQRPACAARKGEEELLEYERTSGELLAPRASCVTQVTQVSSLSLRASKGGGGAVAWPRERRVPPRGSIAPGKKIPRLSPSPGPDNLVRASAFYAASDPVWHFIFNEKPSSCPRAWTVIENLSGKIHKKLVTLIAFGKKSWETEIRERGSSCYTLS